MDLCPAYSRRELSPLVSCPQSFSRMGEDVVVSLFCKQGNEAGKEWVGRDQGLRGGSSGL